VLSRVVDRGAITAAFVGIGMAVTIGVSFLLVIPVEPVYWYLSIPAGLLIGYYADARSGRGRGAWARILANATFAGFVTGLTLAALLLGVKALFYAIEKNNLVYVQKVLSMNFDPNLHHENGYTALAYAAAKGNPQMVDLLLRNGADAALSTREGDTPVELALRFGHAEVADVLKRARQAALGGNGDAVPQPQAG